MFWILHILVGIFLTPALLITIPLHIIVANQNKNAQLIIDSKKD